MNIFGNFILKYTNRLIANIHTAVHVPNFTNAISLPGISMTILACSCQVASFIETNIDQAAMCLDCLQNGVKPCIVELSDSVRLATICLSQQSLKFPRNSQNFENKYQEFVEFVEIPMKSYEVLGIPKNHQEFLRILRNSYEF